MKAKKMKAPLGGEELQALVAEAVRIASALGHEPGPLTPNQERFSVVARGECLRCGLPITATTQPLFGLPKILGCHQDRCTGQREAA